MHHHRTFLTSVAVRYRVLRWADSTIGSRPAARFKPCGVHNCAVCRVCTGHHQPPTATPLACVHAAAGTTKVYQPPVYRRHVPLLPPCTNRAFIDTAFFLRALSVNAHI